MRTYAKDDKDAACETQSRTAYMFSSAQCFGPYEVQSLSAGGVVVIGRYLPENGTRVDILLLESGKRQLRLPAQVIYTEQTEPKLCTGAVVFQKPAYDLIEKCDIEEMQPPITGAESCGPMVLVVDDCEEICRALKGELAKLGRRVVYALNPIDAISMLIDPDLSIDSVVVDLFLGEYDGLDVLHFISEKRPELRRVLISGRVRSQHLDLAQASGSAHAVVPKPWDPDHLARALEL
ncbi:MAG: response regulator [Deltaproteobacteria bacterium]|nr:response regulator [Deltaproteobacteria bacterium]MBW1870746.1 response regulator [Deltaproteobacteria bacterium]